VSGTNPPARDPDDWWADVPAASPGGRTDAPLGDTTRDEANPLAYRVRMQLPLTPRARLLGMVGVAILVLLVIGLLAAGAFTGSSKKNQPPTTHQTTTRGTKTTPTTTPTQSTIVAPTVTLKPGDSGTQVKRLQRALAQLGYSTGTVDGSYGPKTVAAVESFQQAEGLTKDGVVGPKTLAALRAKLAG
jgi:hypothetical protein